MTDESVGSIAWLADMLGKAWAPSDAPPLAPLDADLAPIHPAMPSIPPAEVAAVEPPMPLQRAGGGRV